MISNKENFYIKKVIVKNFRGYEGEVSFNFEKDNETPKLILLTGPNGYGKTSLIDAIEWCFTGEISRLKKSLNIRVDSKDKKNKKNNDGLIRNINSEESIVEVKIYANYNDEDICIERRVEGNQLENECINGLNSDVIINCENQSIANKLSEKLLSFNKDNICSYDKNIDLYNQGRADIYKLFSHLYNDKYNINIIIQNLENAKNNLDNGHVNLKSEIEEINKKITLYIDTKKNYDNDMNGINYPKNKIFEKEIILNDIDSTNINIKDIEKQIKILSNIRNIELCSELNDIIYILNENLKKNKQKELLKLLKDNKEIYEKLINTNFKDIKENIEELENIKIYTNKINSYKDLVSNKDYKAKIMNIPIEFIYKSINHLDDINKTIEEHEKKIETYSDKNPTVKVLRYIVDNTKELEVYRENHSDCPICGNSDTFKQAEIGRIAKRILGENDIERQNIKNNIKSLIEKGIEIIEELKKTIITYIEKKVLILEEVLNKENSINSINRLFKELDIEYNEDSILNLEKNIAQSSITNIDNKEEDLINYISLKKYYYFNDINDDLSYEKYRYLKLEEKINIIKLITSRLEINFEDFEEYKDTNKEQLDNRISICDSYIKLLQKDKLAKKLEELEKIKSTKSSELILLEKKLENIKIMIKNMKSLKTKDEKAQTEKIQKPLDNIYRKITRNTNIKKIELSRAKANNSSELDIVDFNGKKTSFANILSAGQLSTLAISIFLAKASLRDENSIKLYLMDEPIQTMDNLNILSFIDLVKYQLKKESNRSFIDQIIFSTCDENLSRLFTYKLNSFDIPICEYKFDGNSKPIQV